MMKTKLYTQNHSFKSEIISSVKKLDICFRVFAILLISFISLNGIAQTISNVEISTAAVCPGSKISISFTVTNGTGTSNYFTALTNYTIYVSNSSGTGFQQFTQGLKSSSTPPPSVDGGSAIITLSNLTTPPTVPLGTGYKISISSDVPHIPVNSGSNVSGPITVGANPTISYSKVFASSCGSGTDGSISVTANGGHSPYSYTWTGYPNPGSYSASTPTINNLALGDYTIVVKDANQCSAKVPGITIKQAPPVKVGVTKTIPTCAGNDGILNVYRIGGVYDGITPIQYKIDGTTSIPYQNSGSFTGLMVGVYIVTVKDSKGCTATSLVNLPADTRPAPSAGVMEKTLPSCGTNNGSISALRIGGVNDGVHAIQYKLDGDASVPYQTSNVFNGLALGNYFVTVKDSRGCTGIVAVSLPEDARPAPSVGISQKTNPGCSFNDGTISSFRINGVRDDASPIQFKLDGTTSVPYQSSGEFSNLSAGNYTVTVQDSRGCTGSLPVVLTQSEPLSFTPNGYNTNVSACGNGSDGSTTVTVAGGVAPYHFMLDGVEKEVRSYGTYTIRDLQPNVAYNVGVTDSKGCSISKNVTLMQEAVPAAIIAYKGNATCIGGNDGFITVGHTGGVPGYNYSNDGGITYQGSYVFYNLGPSMYNIIVKDSKGCLSAPVAVSIADGTGSCVAGRSGNLTNTNNERRIGTDNNGVINHSKSLLNSSLTIKAYPNPFASDFTLNVNGNNQDKVSIIVTDVTGRRIYQAHGNANRQYRLGSALKKGIYIVQVMQQDNVQTIKIVKE